MAQHRADLGGRKPVDDSHTFHHERTVQLVGPGAAFSGHLHDHFAPIRITAGPPDEAPRLEPVDHRSGRRRRQAGRLPELAGRTVLAPEPVQTPQVGAVQALDAVRAVAFPTRTNIMVSGTGRELGRMSLGHPLDDGTPALTVKRSKLIAALVAQCITRGIPVHHDSRVAHAEPQSGRVRMTLVGGHTDLVDVLVGADGVRSSVRGWVDAQAPAARFVGLTNSGGITRGAASWSEAEPEAWRFVFGRRAFFGYIPTPDGDVVWFVNEPRGQISAEERMVTTASEWSSQLSGLFDDDSGPASRLISAGDLELAGDNTFDLGHVPRWHRGGLIVIGDAAHAPAPSSGQGASMAMEDGVVLAQYLRDHSTVAEAFNAYERLRRKRVERIVAAGARSSSSKTPNAWVRPVRDVFLRMVFRFAVTERSTAWMYDHRISWNRHVSRPGS